jgi:hypothetical protein
VDQFALVKTGNVDRQSGGMVTRAVVAPPIGLLLLGLTLLGIAAAIVALEPWHGPILISLVSGRGVDSGDLVVLPLVIAAVLAFASARRRSGQAGGREPRPSRFDSATLGAALGVLLLLAQALRLADLDETRLLALLLCGIIIALTIWFGVEVVSGQTSFGAIGPKADGRLAGILLFAGLIIDALVVPSGTAFGIVLPTAYLASRVRSRLLATLLGALATFFLGATIMSLADIAGVDVLLSKDEGGVFRAIALGIVLTCGGGFVMFSGGAFPSKSRLR